MISFLWSLYSHTRFLWCSEKKTPNTKYLLELIKRRSKVQENNISCERALNFNQWKSFCETYEPMRVWLWLAYKFTENYCRVQLFSKFIQTQKRYPTSLDKIHILTWRLLVISSQNFLWTKLLENLLLAKYLISVAATLKVRNFEFPISNSVTNKEYSYGKSMEKICIKRIKVYEMLWHHFYNLKNVKKTPMEGCYFWKSCWLQHTPPCVFFKLCKWYQIAQSIT